jgi:hypothetical protein
MILAAHQPNYLPNLSFFNKMKEADLFVIVTNIQFEKHEGWQQRHKIPSPNKDLWLTVPVMGSQNQLIKDVRINNLVHWRNKHYKSLELFYKKKNGNYLLPQFSEIYQKEWERLVDINVAVILQIKEILGITTPVILDEDVSGVKHTLLINICKKYGADTFLSGLGAKSYLDDDRLKEMEKNGVVNKFVTKQIGSKYPYSTVHYLLENGADWVKHAID